MKKFIGFLAVAALIIAGTQVLHRHQNKPLVFPSEKQSLRDAPNDPAASGNSQEGTIIPYEVGDIMGSSPTPIRNMIIVMDGSKLQCYPLAEVCWKKNSSCITTEICYNSD